MGEETTEEPDLELLTRKIAKCDRLITKKGTAKGDIAKLKRKRSEYVLQLGELAYRAAQASAMNLVASPTMVTEKLDPSKFQQFNDSLAVFEHSSLPHTGSAESEGAAEPVAATAKSALTEADEEAPLERETPVGLPEEDAPPEIMEEEVQDEDESELIDTSQILQTLPAADDEVPNDQFDEASEVVVEEGEAGLALIITECVEKVVDEVAAEAATDKMVAEATADEVRSSDSAVYVDDDFQIAPDDEEDPDKEITNSQVNGTLQENEGYSPYTPLPSSEVAPVAEDPEAANVASSEKHLQDNEGDAGSEVLEIEESGPETTQQDDETPEKARDRPEDDCDKTGPFIENGKHMGESMHTAATDEGSIALAETTPLTATSSPSTTTSNHSVDEQFDGEGSVSKLRAVFDSPDGEKPRRSWKPKKIIKNIPPAPLASKEANEQDPNLPPTVTMKVQMAHSTKSSTITLYQAVMTSSVHDIDSQLVALVSLFPESMYEYLPKQNRALLIFKALNIHPIYVDGSNPDEKERRNELFEISGKRGVYPQLFVRKQGSGKLEFFADFDKIELLNDCQTLKEEIEAAIR